MTTSSDRRLHPFSILFSIGSEITSVVLPALALMMFARRGNWDWSLLWFLPFYVVFACVRYWSSWFRFDADDLVVRTGLLFRKERHIRYGRIQNIEILTNPLHRWLGVAEVRLETGGGEEPEAKLQVLSADDAEDVRRRVFEKQGRAAVIESAGEAGTASAEAVLFQMPLRDIVLFGFIHHRGMVMLAAAAGVVWQTDLVDFNRLGEFVWRSVARGFEGRAIDFGHLGETDWRAIGLDALQHLRSRLGAAGILAVVGGLALLVLAIQALSVAWAVLQLHGFRLVAEADALRTSCGLLTRVRGVIPRGRIQLVTILESPFHRWFARAGIKVETAGGDQGATAARQWLAPIARRSDVPRLLSEVVPGLDLEDVEWHPAAARAHWRLFRKWVFPTVVVTLGLWFLTGAWTLIVTALMITLAWTSARQQARWLGHAITPDFVLHRGGWLWRHVSVAPHDRIQAVSWSQTLFDRRWRMANVYADTAGGGAHPIFVAFLDADEASRLFRDLVERTERTRFRW